MKAVIRNLFILLLVAFSLTGFPLNPELVHLDLSRFSYENAVRMEAEKSRITYAYVLDAPSGPQVNPDAITFLIRAEGGKKPKWTEPPPLVLQVETGNQAVQTVAFDQFAHYIEPAEGFNPWELRYQLKLSRKSLHLTGSTYTFKVSAKAEDLTGLSPLSIPIQYLDALKYTAAITDTATEYAQVYFPDAQSRFVVPVSRPLAKNAKRFRSNVNALSQMPPASMELIGTAFAPRISVIRYVNGLVNCTLADPVPPELYTNPQLATLTEKALTETIAAVKSNYTIRKVQYSWKAETPLPNWPQDAITVSQGPKVWLGLPTASGRVLIVPSETDKGSVEDLFNILKAGQNSLIPTVPGQAQLLDRHMEGNVLILNLDKSIHGLLQNSPDQMALMLDSLANTFTGLPGVDSVRIDVNGTPITTLGNMPFTNPLLPRPNVNPETE